MRRNAANLNQTCPGKDRNGGGVPESVGPDTPAALSQVAGRPSLDTGEATEQLRRHWGITGRLQPLESERDKNWLVVSDEEPTHVLKVANVNETAHFVELQQTMMRHLHDADIPCPIALTTKDGSPTADFEGHLAWLITVVPGRKLATVDDPSERLWRHLGQVIGRAAKVLAKINSPAASRWLQWDVANADRVLTTYRTSVAEPTRRDMLDSILQEFRRDVAPLIHELPRSLIHNDANDHNVLVDGDAVSGLIDFGDAVHSLTVNDLAVACAYAMLDRQDPWSVADAIRTGYEHERRLSPTEATVLSVLIRTRLATSVSISAYQRTLEPDNDYLQVSEQPAWNLLSALM